MRTSPVLSPLELSILGAIRARPRSGYEMRKAFASSAIAVGDSPGAVYPALRRLRKAGFIEPVADRSTGRSKQVFHLTTPGRRALQNAATAPISHAEISADPERLLLRATVLEEAEVREFLKRYAAAMRDYAGELRANGSQSLLVDYAIAMCTARARWAERVITEKRFA